jgi:hypothetical protein
MKKPRLGGSAEVEGLQLMHSMEGSQENDLQ